MMISTFKAAMVAAQERRSLSSVDSDVCGKPGGFPTNLDGSESPDPRLAGVKKPGQVSRLGPAHTAHRPDDGEFALMRPKDSPPEAVIGITWNG